MRVIRRKNRWLKDTVRRDLSELVRPHHLEIPFHFTVDQVLELLRKKNPSREIFYLYVVNDGRKLLGVLSLRNLLFANGEESLGNILQTDLTKLKEGTSLKEAAKVFSSTKFLSLPIVDTEERILGVVHAHEVAAFQTLNAEDILSKETQTELFDVLGIQAEDPGHNIFKLALKRMPWLFINLIGGLLCAVLIENLAPQNALTVQILAFVPILLVINESLGMQTTTLLVNHLHSPSKRKKIFYWIRRDFWIASLTAIGIAISFFLLASLMTPKKLSLIASFTLVIGGIFVTLIASLIPLFLKKYHLDPKVSSGPVVLSLSDLLTLTLYLCFCTFFLS